MTNQLATTDNVTANIIPEGAFNTVDMSTFEGAMKVTNAINNSQSLSEYIDTNTDKNGNTPILNVVDIVVTPGVRKAREKNQEDMPCEDTRLILADGISLMTQSGGIARSARFIAGLCGAELHDGILIRVVSQKLRNGNTIKNLEIVGKAQ